MFLEYWICLIFTKNNNSQGYYLQQLSVLRKETHCGRKAEGVAECQKTISAAGLTLKRNGGRSRKNSIEQKYKFRIGGRHSPECQSIWWLLFCTWNSKQDTPSSEGPGIWSNGFDTNGPLPLQHGLLQAPALVRWAGRWRRSHRKGSRPRLQGYP